MDKRKHSSDSGETPEAKTARNGGSPVGMIDSIREANSVLLDDSIQELCGGMTPNRPTNEHGTDDKMQQHGTDEGTAKIYETKETKEPNKGTSDEILLFLKKIDNRLENVEKSLTKLDSLEAKVTNIDLDVKKLWVYVQDKIKSCDEKVNKCTDHVEELQFALGEANDRISSLTRDHAKLNDEMDYIRSQSMRNNLVFVNIPESMNEKPSVTESKVRDFMVHQMGLQQDTVDQISIERAHRATHPPDGVNSADFAYDSNSDREARSHGPPRKPRNVFVKFASFKDRELVRKSSRNLKGTCYFVHEQFPKAVNERRKSLYPRLKDAIRDGHRAWISYDTLYIDGRPQPHATANSVRTSENAESLNGAADASTSGRGGPGDIPRGSGRRGRGGRGGSGGRRGGSRGGRS